jgi:hypothetical protein
MPPTASFSELKMVDPVAGASGDTRGTRKMRI